MSIDSITSDIELTLRCELTDQNGDVAATYLLADLGEVYLRYPNGQHYKLTVEPIAADDLTFIDEEDWSL